jgi:hypothetical protein
MNPRRTREVLLGALSVSLFMGGALASYFAFRRGGVDFLSFRIMADGIVHGINVYDPVARDAICERYGLTAPLGMYYPPATGFILSPLALPPYPVAKAIWFSIMVASVVLGVRALVRLAVPGSPNRLWMAASGLILMSSSLRWGLMLLQGAPLMLGLLCAFVVCLHRGKARSADAIAMLATAYKLTLALPFLGLLLLRRRYLALVVSVGVPVLLNALGFLRMGEGAFANYQHDVASLDAFGDNINAPDPWMPVALPRLDWVFLVYGFTRNLAVARFVTLAASAAVALWLIREGLRTRAPSNLDATATFSAPLVCLGSLCVYHHQYDLCVFFVPILLGSFAGERLRRPTWALWLIAPLVLMMTLLPIGRAEAFVQPLFGPLGVALLKLAFPVALTLALVGSLVILRRLTGEKTRGSSSSGEPRPELAERHPLDT